MSGVFLLSAWCVVGGAVGGLIGHHSGRLGVGLVLGSFCGVFGWLLLAGAEPRSRAAAASPAPGHVVEPTRDTAAPFSPAPLSWMARLDDQPMATTGRQL